LIFKGLIDNLAMLVVLSVVSGYIGQRWRDRRRLVVLQGLLFGSVSVIGMLSPVVFGTGLIFDGRSVIISLCGLFFGPIAVGIAATMALICRILQGGVGSHMGVLVITASAILGIICYYRWTLKGIEVSIWQFLGLGLLVHISMLLCTLALPLDMTAGVLKRITLPVILIYPFATIIIGKVLSDQESRSRFIEELRKSEEKFKAIADYTMDWESWFKPDRSLYWVNPAVEQITGYSPDEVLAMPDYIQTLVAEEDRQVFVAHFNEAIQGNRRRNFEFRYLHKNGSKYWLNMSWQPIYDVNGGYLGIRASGRDITERKKSEQALKLSEEKFSKTFFLSPDAININSLQDGRYIEINQGFTEITGYTKEDVMGHSSLPDDLGVWVNAENRSRLVQGLQDSGEVVGLEAKFRKKDGTIIIGMMSARIVEFEGEPCVLSVTRDISERISAEKEKRQFYRDTIKSVTQGKLDLVSFDDVKQYLDSAELVFCAVSIHDASTARHRIMEYCISSGIDHNRLGFFESAFGEAITNAIKHASDCRIYVGKRDDSIWVGISDTGPGISTMLLPGATLRRGYSSKVSMGLGYSIMMEASDNIMLCTGSNGTTVILSVNMHSPMPSLSLDEFPDTWNEINAAG